MDKVKVSIIIPVYNVAPFLEKCLLSCINQTFRDIFIIVVNDGSPDESEQIITAFSAKDKRIVVINKKNEGLIYARKSGLEVARGTYVYHLDGDDYIETNAIEMLYNKAIESASDYVVSNYYEVCGSNKAERIQYELGGLSGQEFVVSMIAKRKWNIWGRLIRKALFDDVVYRPIFMGEDLYFNMQVGYKVEKVEVVNAYLYNYNRHSDSVTALRDDKSFLVNVEMLRGILSLPKIYDYNQLVIDELYVICLQFYRSTVAIRKKNINYDIFFDYLKKEGMDIFGWKQRLSFKLMHSVYLYSPFISFYLVRILIKSIFWNKKYFRSV